MDLSQTECDYAVKLFQKLVSFRTTSHSAALDNQYCECASFLVDELIKAGITDAHVLPESLPNKPIVVGSVPGTEKELPGILLNSHYDVVPVIESDWTIPPFSGVIKDDRIYGRGTQDMKCVCVQYIIALKTLIQSGLSMKRTVYLSFVPDEEIGGTDGMNRLMQSLWWLHSGGNIDLALDEGLASEDESYNVFYGERLPWWVFFESSGNTGHGSRFIPGTAVESVVKVVNKALAYRESQRRILHGFSGAGDDAGCSHIVAAKKTLGDVTSMNVTSLSAGMVSSEGRAVLNVVPSTAKAGLDIRISPLVPPADIESMLDSWCQEVNSCPANARISWKLEEHCLKDHATTLLDEQNHWWQLFQSTLRDGFSIDLKPAIFPAATDSRFLRAHGYKAFGFSPIRRSPVLLHENDEYLSVPVFLEGCTVYIRLIASLANFPPNWVGGRQP